MKEIPLTKGFLALVDDGDFERVNQYKWQVCVGKYSNYARHRFWSQSKYTHMHRFIMDAPDGMDVDHIDGNGLNNQKSNLRVCNRSQNQINKGLKSNNKSGHTGVWYLKRNKRWWAYIGVYGKDISLGYFKDKEDAIKAREEGVKKYYGEFAYSNRDSKKGEKDESD